MITKQTFYTGNSLTDEEITPKTVTLGLNCNSGNKLLITKPPRFEELTH